MMPLVVLALSWPDTDSGHSESSFECPQCAHSRHWLSSH